MLAVSVLRRAAQRGEEGNRWFRLEVCHPQMDEKVFVSSETSPPLWKNVSVLHIAFADTNQKSNLCNHCTGFSFTTHRRGDQRIELDMDLTCTTSCFKNEKIKMRFSFFPLGQEEIVTQWQIPHVLSNIDFYTIHDTIESDAENWNEYDNLGEAKNKNSKNESGRVSTPITIADSSDDSSEEDNHLSKAEHSNCNISDEQRNDDFIFERVHGTKISPISLISHGSNDLEEGDWGKDEEGAIKGEERTEDPRSEKDSNEKNIEWIEIPDSSEEDSGDEHNKRAATNNGNCDDSNDCHEKTEMRLCINSIESMQFDDDVQSDIILPIELEHKIVKINGENARVMLHYVDQNKSICEFLNGPDKGRFTFSLNKAYKRLYGANGNGWTNFLYNGKPLQEGPKRLGFKNTCLPSFTRSPELDDPKQDFIAQYKALPWCDRKKYLVLPNGDTVTGITRGKRSKGSNSHTITSTSSAGDGPSKFTSEDYPPPPPQPTIISLSTLPSATRSPVVPPDVSPSPKRISYPSNPSPRISYPSNPSPRISYPTNPSPRISYPTNPSPPPLLLPSSAPPTPVVPCPTLLPTNPMASERTSLFQQKRKAPDSSDNAEQPPPMIRNANQDESNDTDMMDSGDSEGDVALPLGLIAIRQHLDRFFNDHHTVMGFDDYRFLVDHIANINKDVFDAMNNIDTEGTVGKPDREQLLLKMINDQFNKLLPGTFDYLSVARFVHNMTPGDSQPVIAAKLALGVVVAKRYLEKSQEDTRIPKKALNVLVAGFVQFGKTSNMLLLSAILADRGFKYIIILSGRTIVLRNQTASRCVDAFKEPVVEPMNDSLGTPPDTPQSIEEDEASTDVLPEIDREGVTVSVYEGHASKDIGKRMLRQLLSEDTLKGVCVLVCKKNRDIISNLCELVQDKCQADTKVALIDDEADDSVNTKAEGKSYTQLYRALLGLYSECAKRSASNFAYFAYTATTAACLLQQSTAKIRPDVLAFMVLNQPSYLGLEHFISPEFLTLRTIVTEGAVDFLEADSNTEKLKVIPLTKSLGMLKFILQVYKKSEEALKEVSVSVMAKCPLNSLQQSDYCSILRTLVNLLRTKYQNKFTTEEILKLETASNATPSSPPTSPSAPASSTNKPSSTSTSSTTTPRNAEKGLKRVWNPEPIRVAEALYNNLSFSRRAVPEWLLVFVFRSLLTWVICVERKKPQRNNNLYSTLLEYTRIDLTLCYASYRNHKNYKSLNNALTEFLSDEDFNKVDTADDILASPNAQQRIFQWDEHGKSNEIIRFLALFFEVNIRVLAASHELLCEYIVGNDTTFVNIKCGKDRYVCTLEFSQVSAYVEPQYSAFMHISGRQIVHENYLLVLRKILKLLRRDSFWRVFGQENPKYNSWTKALNRAYQHTVTLREKYAEQERKLNLPTLESSHCRPPIPELQDLIPKIRSLLGRVDRNGRCLVDCRVRMTRKFLDPDDVTVNLTIRDLITSDDNPLPQFMFIIGGDCFTRGVTLPTPLTSVFLRLMENQEQLTQALRWCGHRQPEAIDLMNIMCGEIQKSQFKRLWSKMSTNTLALLKHDLDFGGNIRQDKLTIYQEKGSLAAPKNKMHYADVLHSNKPIHVSNPPIRGDACFAVFLAINYLFDTMLMHYTPECPGNRVASHNAETTGDVARKSKPGILFRNVLKDNILQHLTNIQSHYTSPYFWELVAALQKAEQEVNVLFVHRKNSTRFTNSQPRYMKKLREYIRENNKARPQHALLDYISPVLYGREKDEFEEIDFDRRNAVDAMRFEGKRRFTLLPEYSWYLNIAQNTTQNTTRSQRAPPLLLIALFDPEFKCGRADGDFARIYHDEKDFCDFPPVGFCLYPEYQGEKVKPQKKRKITASL